MPYAEVVENGRCLARCYLCWVDTPLDILEADDGKDIVGKEGVILYIADLESVGQGMLWKLRGKLPKARYIVGLDDHYRLHTPKGVPEEWESFFSSLV